jgi:hypothetical protein
VRKISPNFSFTLAEQFARGVERGLQVNRPVSGYLCLLLPRPQSVTEHLDSSIDAEAVAINH